jgi:HEAT repeat protein
VNRSVEDRILQFRRLRSARTENAEADVRKGLQDRSNLVAAEAARTAAALRLSSLIPAMLAAFERLFHEPVKSDAKCWAKTAIVKALTDLDYDQSGPFVRGLSHVQMEPVMGGREDTASQLRALSALALVQCSDLGRVRIMRHLLEALTDVNEHVRCEAIRALAQLGGDEAALVLRLKGKLGDPEVGVLGHVFDALISLEEGAGVAFVEPYLDSARTDIRDEAALALGASRRADAVAILIARWKDSSSSEFRDVLLRAMASSRIQPAVDFLLELVGTGSDRESAAALAALELLEGSEEIQNQIEAAKRRRQ